MPGLIVVISLVVTSRPTARNGAASSLLTRASVSSQLSDSSIVSFTQCVTTVCKYIVLDTVGSPAKMLCTVKGNACSCS